MFVGLVSVPLILDCPVANAPPVKLPVTVGALHAYVVPNGTISVPLVGVTEKLLPLHAVAVVFAIAALGLTVTVTVKVEPTQLPAAPLVGVTVYKTVCAVLVKLVSVCPIVLTPIVCVASPVTFTLSTTVHVYVVLAGIIVAVGLFVGRTLNAVPLQIVAV